jgi:hypothetical protein
LRSALSPKPRVAEVDLNPVIVHQEGAGVSLIDARVRLSE